MTCWLKFVSAGLPLLVIVKINDVWQYKNVNSNQEIEAMKCTCLLSVVGALVAVGSIATAQDSAWYRGPSRDGVYANAAIRTNWKEKPPAVLWRKDIGYGFSGAAVVGKKLVTAGYAQDTGKSML